MQVFTNGYGEKQIFWQVGDRAIYTSQKYPDLAPYEVTITAVYAEYNNGHPAYLDHGKTS